MNIHPGGGAGSHDESTRTSDLLRDFTGSLDSERVSLEEIIEGLGDRGLGVLLAIFALPNMFPSLVPFGNVATGIPPLIFAIQLTMGEHRLTLPAFAARRTVATKPLKAAVPRVASVLSWFESLLHPRLPWVTSPRGERFVGAVAIFLAAFATLPVFGGHQAPSLGLMLIGLGLVERDGLAIIAGAVIGVVGIALYGLVVYGLVHGLGFLFFHHRRRGI